jgi:hypothetical protein
VTEARQNEHAELRPGLLTQAAPITTVDQEARTVEVVFSTSDLCSHWVRHNGEVRRMPTRVVMEEGAADLETLKASGPVLNSHMSWGLDDVIGSVQDAWIENGRAMARLKFSADPEVESIWRKVQEGTLRNVSMGFEVEEQELREEEGPNGQRMDVMYFTRWTPREISMVAIGADRGARTQGVARGQIDGMPGEFAGTQAAAAAQTSQEETHMAEKTQGAAVQAQTPEGSTVTTQSAPPAPAPDLAEVRLQAARAERDRIDAIRQTGAALGADDTLIQSAISDATSADEFRRQAIEAFAQKGQKATEGLGGPRAHVTQDVSDKFRQGAALGLMARGGLPGGERNEFTGMTLAELARQSLSIRNASMPSDRREMIGHAFTQSAGAHSTSDFAEVLSNVAGKAALRGWSEAEETFERWTRAGTLADFRASKRVGLGLIDSLPEVPEGGEYKHGTVSDRGENITLATYGSLLKITRQAIINDDLSLFTSVPVRMGRAAKRTIGNLVYAILTNNPNMSDGTALFHADHNNLAATAAAPSVTSLAAARAAMRIQKEAAGGAVLNITPAYFIVPAALETTAMQLMASIVDPTANKGHAMNPVSGMAEVVADGRLDADSATAWYLAANPDAFDTIEVAYLDGVQEPFIEQQTAWSMDGVELKVRIDAAAAPLEWRTLFKNAGA